MPEPLWYYARGEVERGPFNAVQIKALVVAGKVRPDDLVWKEGMENWTAAGEVTELFPNGRPAGEARLELDQAVASSPSEPRALAHRSRELADLTRSVGHGCLLVGLITIVFARGCDSLGQRRIARLDAAAKLESAEELQRQHAALAAEIGVLKEKSRPTPLEQDRLREVTESLQRIDESLAKAEIPAERRRVVDRAIAELHVGAFARGIGIYGGAFFLLLGGFTLASFAHGADRWLGTGILLVLAFWALTPPEQIGS